MRVTVESAGYSRKILRINGNTLSGSSDPTDLDWVFRTFRARIFRGTTSVLLVWLGELDRHHSDTMLNHARAKASKFDLVLLIHKLAPSIVKIAGQNELRDGYYLSAQPET